MILAIFNWLGNWPEFTDKFMIVFSGIDISNITTTEDISSIPTELPDFNKFTMLIISLRVLFRIDILC